MSGIKSALSSTGRIIAYLLLCVFILILIVAGCSAIFSPPVSPNDIKVASVSGTLATAPDIHNSNKSKYIRLKLNEYPNRSFKVDGDAYYASASTAIGYDLHAGDSIYMQVAADDYRDNIESQQAPHRMLPVAVYAFHSKTESFLTLEGYCKEANSGGNTWAGIFCFVMAVAIVFAMYFDVKKRKRLKKA